MDWQAAYERILGYTPRLMAASFLAYLVGEFSNAYVLVRMKAAIQGRFLWTRTIGSTLVGQGLDSLVFISVAFAGTIPAAGLATAVVPVDVYDALVLIYGGDPVRMMET